MKKLAVILLGLVTITAAVARNEDGRNRHVRIINRASSPIFYLYASNVDRLGWEEDLLGDNIISTDHYVDANIDDGTGHCLFDLKAVLFDGRTAVRNNFNVCTESSWTVTN